MSEPENTLCLVCDEPLSGDDDGVTAVKGLYWHKDCLGYIPNEEWFDRVRHEDGHAVMDRLGSEVDISVLFRRSPGYYDRTEVTGK